MRDNPEITRPAVPSSLTNPHWDMTLRPSDVSRSETHTYAPLIAGVRVVVTAGPLSGFSGVLVQRLGTKCRLQLEEVECRVLAEVDEGFVNPVRDLTDGNSSLRI